MGIRIQQQLGWVYQSTTPDLNLSALEGYTLEDMAKKFGHNFDVKIDLELIKKPNLQLTKLVTFYEDEETNQYVYVFTPPAQYKNWLRYGDTLDHYTITQAVGFRDESLRVQTVEGELYPYLAKWVVSSTGNPLTDAQTLICRTDMTLKQLQNPLKKQLKDLGFKDGLLRKQIHHPPPMTVHILAEMCGVTFPKLLKPGLVFSWS